jgi:hypothetical protein
VRYRGLQQNATRAFRTLALTKLQPWALAGTGESATANAGAKSPSHVPEGVVNTGEIRKLVLKKPAMPSAVLVQRCLKLRRRARLSHLAELPSSPMTITSQTSRRDEHWMRFFETQISASAQSRR